MRKLVSILFVGFYTFSVVALSIERTQVWVADRTRDAKHTRQNGARIGEWHRRSTRQFLSTKLIEDGSDLASPFITANPPHSETALHHLLSGLVAARSVRVTSSRAPPIALS